MKAKEAIAAAWRSHDEHNTDAILYLDAPTKEFFVTIPRQGWRAIAEYIGKLEHVAALVRTGHVLSHELACALADLEPPLTAEDWKKAVP